MLEKILFSMLFLALALMSFYSMHDEETDWTDVSLSKVKFLFWGVVASGIGKYLLISAFLE